MIQALPTLCKDLTTERAELGPAAHGHTGRNPAPGGQTAARTRPATDARRASPAPCPKLSLTSSNRLRSTNTTATHRVAGGVDARRPQRLGRIDEGEWPVVRGHGARRVAGQKIAQELEAIAGGQERLRRRGRRRVADPAASFHHGGRSLGQRHTGGAIVGHCPDPWLPQSVGGRRGNWKSSPDPWRGGSRSRRGGRVDEISAGSAPRGPFSAGARGALPATSAPGIVTRPQGWVRSKWMNVV